MRTFRDRKKLYAALLLIIALLLCLAGCGSSQAAMLVRPTYSAEASEPEREATQSGKGSEDGNSELEALVAYARELEEGGNYAAAAKVWELIEKAALNEAEAEMQRTGEESVKDIDPLYKAMLIGNVFADDTKETAVVGGGVG